MPKAILEFSLPEENVEFKEACEASSLKYAVQDFDNFLRAKLKYEELSEETYKAYDEIRSKLYEELNARDLNLFD